MTGKQTHPNLQEITEHLYLHMRTFLCYFQQISVSLSLADYTQKAPLFELENTTKYSADFFRVIHTIFVAAIHKYVH